MLSLLVSLFRLQNFPLYLRHWPVLTGDICSESPPKVCEIDMAQGEDMSKGPGTEEIMFLSAFILEI